MRAELEILFFFKFVKLLERHWLIKLDMFQVCNSIINHLILCVYHPNSSLFLSSFLRSLPISTPSPHPRFPLVITTPLSASMRFGVFLLNPFTFFNQPFNSLPSDSCQSVFCFIMSLFLFCFFILLIRLHI